MSTPAPVTIVRPHKSTAAVVGTVVGFIGGLLLVALFVWLLAPFVWADYPLGYLQTLAALYIIRVAAHSGSGWHHWTARG